jgi:hypothetical protein
MNEKGLPPIKQPSFAPPSIPYIGDEEFQLHIEPPATGGRIWNRLKKEPWIPLG